jgi:hypothetical protein
MRINNTLTEDIIRINGTNINNITLFNGVDLPTIPSILLTSLSLHLNVNDVSSYSGSGTTWNDISSNANVVTLINSPTYSANNGGYIEFDGINDYGNEATSTGSPFAFGTGAFTLEYWVYYNNATNPQIVLDMRRRDTNFSTNEATVDSRSTARNWRYYYKSAFILTSTNTLADATWHHVVLSRNSTGTNDTKLYFNNVLDSSHTWNYNFSDYGVFYIARNINTTGTGYMNGRVAQIRVYKGKALTAAEVENNWNATKALYGY